MPQSLLLIYARAENGTIGKDGAMPWHIPADLKRFKTLTLGKPMIMGRKTFESLPGLLPKRRHIVLTRDEAWNAEGAEVVHSPAKALALAGPSEVAIIGGAEIFDLFMERADRIELTQIQANYPGDAFMDTPGAGWRVTGREDHTGEGEKPAYSFITYERTS